MGCHLRHLDRRTSARGMVALLVVFTTFQLLSSGERGIAGLSSPSWSLVGITSGTGGDLLLPGVAGATHQSMREVLLAPRLVTKGEGQEEGAQRAIEPGETCANRPAFPSATADPCVELPAGRFRGP